MNKFTLLAIAILLFSACDKDDDESTTTTTPTTANPTPASIGDFRDGGVVFYVDSVDSTHGLVCSLSDQSTGIQWYNGSNSATGATGITIGSGKANTDAIIANQGATQTDYAAGLARAHNGGGFNDWFLPSQDELAELYKKSRMIDTIAMANGGSSFNYNQLYWSSTEYNLDSTQAIWQYFDANGSGGNGFMNKNATNYYVRAIRAF